MPAIDDTKTHMETESAQLAQTSAAGKFAESLKSEIDPAIAKRKQTQTSYKSKRDALVQRWNSQMDELVLLRKDIVSVFSNWETSIKEDICPKLEDLQSQAVIVDSLRGDNEKQVAATAEQLARDKAKLDAWLSIDNWIAVRLNDIDNGIKDIRALFGGAYQVWSIYLFWFRIAPIFISLAPKDKAAEAAAIDGRAELCEGEVKDKQPVYLVEESGYSAEVDAAWATYEKSRKAKLDADKKFKDGPDDLAAELKKLKALIDGLDQAAKNALKPVQGSN